MRKALLIVVLPSILFSMNSQKSKFVVPSLTRLCYKAVLKGNPSKRDMACKRTMLKDIVLRVYAETGNLSELASAVTGFKLVDNYIDDSDKQLLGIFVDKLKPYYAETKKMPVSEYLIVLDAMQELSETAQLWIRAQAVQK